MQFRLTHETTQVRTESFQTSYLISFKGQTVNYGSFLSCSVLYPLVQSEILILLELWIIEEHLTRKFTITFFLEYQN